MKRTAPANLTRTERTLLDWTLAFCRADDQVQKAREEWSHLRAWHSYEGVCCLPVEASEDPEDETAVVSRPALPRSKWCDQCRVYMAEHVNYHEAMFARRWAKAAMKRTAKRLLAKRSE
jgi:hypothetical protein